jgi:uncharacterized protein (DUF305 family)
MTHQGHDGHGTMNPRMVRRHYAMLGVNLILSLAIMYLGMFAMIWSWGDFIQNINFLYMALVMWAPMAAVMLLTMKPMYPDKTINMALHATFALVFVLALVAVRDQFAVGDRQFLRSMIPHHSGALLMCSKAQNRDAEIKRLCGDILRSQTQEIDQMKRIMKRL